MHKQLLAEKKREELSNANIPYFIFGSKHYCMYCGDIAHEIDHVIPISFQTLQGGNQTHFGPVTKTCDLCNRHLTNHWFDTFYERCQAASHIIEGKALPVIWSKKEIETLDSSLKSYVEREQKRRLWYRERADWFQSRDFLLSLKDLLWQPCLDKTNVRYNNFLFNYFNSTIKFVNLLLYK